VRGRRPAAAAPQTAVAVDLTARIGSVTLPNPVMTASGTAGHGAELAPYLDLAGLGAVVVKSLAAFPWAGNPAPRLHPTTAGMLNAVGLQGPGVVAWLRDDLPPLLRTGARVVASIWGRSVEEYRAAADALAGAPPEVVAVEVNLSCPNLEDRRHVFAHSADATRAAIAATAGCRRPRWAKLSPTSPELADVAQAACDGGAEAVTLVNTLLGMVLDPTTGRPVLGQGGGGLSGPAILPVAVRAVFDVRAAHPDLPIVGVGGVATGEDAAQLLLAGAQAVQVGTATFADPRAAARVLAELRGWSARTGASGLDDVVGAAHRGGLP
jgi:dihydroorotate dehydrogenase (NAD+) catalytic subunit